MKAWILAIAASAVSASTPAPDAGWHWPVAPDAAVSSNFGEYRDGRLHAGLDVRTFGRDGIPCQAVADGYVSRLRVSSRGYGKALHLTLDSGEQVVYAHLSEFAPALEETLRAAQAIDTVYAVDFRPPRDRFRVRRGDVLAYSGSTGGVAPHLHIEVRDENDAPVNPFRHGLIVADRLRPQFVRVVLVPLEAGARVAGRSVPMEARLRHRANGRYELADSVRIFGAVGIAAAIVDRANAESGGLAPYEVSVWSDDSLAARLVMERFSFERSGEADLLYQASAMRNGGVALLQLYAPPGVDTELGEFVGGGALVAQPGRIHRALVAATDAAGNTTELSFIYRQDDGAHPIGRWRKSRPFVADLDGGFFGGDFAVIPLAGPGANGDRPIATVRTSDVAGRARPLAAYSDDDTATVYAAGLHASRTESLRVDALGFGLDAAAGALYADAVIYLRGVDAGETGGRELTRRSPAVRVGPTGWVLRRPLTVRLRTEETHERDAIYRSDNGRGWSYLASTRDSSGALSAAASRPGVFAVFRDETAPRVGKARVRTVRSYATGDELPEIVIPVEEAGAGFDEPRLRVWVGGRRRVAWYDASEKKVVVPLAGETIIGEQPVRVLAFDRIGNSSTLDATVEIHAR